MSTLVQLDLFEKIDEFSYLEKKIHENKKQVDNMRRGLFARNGELAKNYINQQQQIDFCKQEIILLKNLIKEITNESRNSDHIHL